MLIAAVVILAIVAGLWIVLAFGPWHRNGFEPQINADTDLHADVALPPVTLIVPARNEASILSTTVPSYCTQEYPDLRVIIVDDQSEDESPKILEEFAKRYSNLTVIRAADRPAGWCGKPWAVQQGVERAATDFLLFTDADCVFHPLAVKQAVTLLLRENFDVLTLLLMMTFGTFAEEIGLAGLASVLMMIMPIALVNDPKSKAALAAGGFILVRRSAYEKIGGHVAVKSEIVEDVKLAQKFKAAGVRLHCGVTSDLVWTRMYEGFADLWEGLSKNAYAASEYQPIKFWLGLTAAMIVIILPPIYLIVSAIALLHHPSPLLGAIAVLSLIIFACQVVVQTRTVRYLKLPIWQSLTMPLSAALYLAIAINSAWEHHFRGGNLWKGRRYTRQSLQNENADPSKPEESASV